MGRRAAVWAVAAVIFAGGCLSSGSGDPSGTSTPCPSSFAELTEQFCSGHVDVLCGVDMCLGEWGCDTGKPYLAYDGCPSGSPPPPTCAAMGHTDPPCSAGELEFWSTPNSYDRITCCTTCAALTGSANSVLSDGGCPDTMCAASLNHYTQETCCLPGSGATDAGAPLPACTAPSDDYPATSVLPDGTQVVAFSCGGDCVLVRDSVTIAVVGCCPPGIVPILDAGTDSSADGGVDAEAGAFDVFIDAPSDAGGD